MSVFTKTYRKYDGELKGRLFRIWAIAYSTFRVQFSGKKAIFLSIACNLPVLSFTLMLVFFAIFSPAAITNMFFRTFFGSLDIGLYLIILFSFNSGSIFMPLVFVAAMNSGSIANDKKNNSLALYMSKPIDKLDYVLGKEISVFLVSSFVTYIPWLVFMVAFTLLSGLTGNQFVESIWVYFAGLAAAIVINLFLGSVVLMFSSLTKQAILAGILTILVLFIPSIIVSSISTALISIDPIRYANVSEIVNYFSISALLVSAVYYIFGKPSAQSIFGGDIGANDFFGFGLNGWISLGIITVIIVIVFLITLRNMNTEEIR